jgi:uncharacterized RDD family membrane protein YckC
MGAMNRLRRLDHRFLADPPKNGAEASPDDSLRVLLLTGVLTFLVLIPVAYVVLWLLSLVGLAGSDGRGWGRAVWFAWIGGFVNVAVSVSQRFIHRR